MCPVFAGTTPSAAIASSSKARAASYRSTLLYTNKTWWRQKKTKGETKEEAQKRKREANKAKAREAKRLATLEPANSTVIKALTEEEKTRKGIKDTEALEKTEDPLGEATKYVKQLLHFAPHRLQSQLLAARVYLEKEKYLLAIKAIRAARRIDAEAPECHVVFCQVLNTLAQNKASPEAQGVIDLESKSESLGGGQSLQALNTAYLARNGVSVAARLAAARVLHLTQGAKGDAAIGKLLGDVSTGDLAVLTELHQFLAQIGSSSAAAVQAVGASRYPLSPYFTPALAAEEETEDVEEEE